MGLIHAEIKLDNPKQNAGIAIRTQALVDTGALHLYIPQALSRQLNLAAERVRRITFADGRSVEAPYVGPEKNRVRAEFRIEVGDSDPSAYRV